MFVNLLTTNEKYSLVNRDNLRQPIQVQLSKKEKTFSEFYSVFLKCTLSFEHFQKKMAFIADIFPNLRTPKKSPFIGPFDKEATCTGDQTLLKSESHHLYHNYWSLWRQLSWKKSLLVTWKVLRMFVNILTAKTSILFLIETI